MKFYVKEPNGDTGVTEVSSIEEAIKIYPAGTLFSDAPFVTEAPAEEESPAPKPKKAK